MRKALSSVTLVGAVLALAVALAVPASADLVAPTPANGSTVHGTITIKDDGSHSGGALLGLCNGSTTITVTNSANATVLSQSVNGTGGGSPIPLQVSWTTESVANGAYKITGSDKKSGSICIGSTTTTTTSNVTVSNVSSLAYGGDTADPTGTSATVKVTITDADGVALPAGQTVSFSLSGSGSTNVTVGANGIAQGTLAVTGAPRSATLTVSYGGGWFTSASTQIPFAVQADPTTTTLTSSLNPSVFGQTVHFNASVASNVSGTGTPTGSVQFTVDGNNLGGPVTLVGGAAQSPDTSTLTAGAHNVVASYTATGNFANSSKSLSETVNKASTTTTVSSSSNPSVFGQSVTFSAHVSVNSPGAGTPTGNVTFQQNGQPIGGPVALDSSGNATSAPISVLTASATPYTITAAYQGDSNFNSSSITAQQAVNKASTDENISSSSEPSVFGQAVTFSTTVVAVAPGAGTPTGTATFSVDGNQLGDPVTLSAAGQATSDAIPTLLPGSHTVTVAYSGDSNFEAVSVTYTQQVDQAATTTVATSFANPSVFGQAIAFNAAVSVVAPGDGTPTGTVTFTVDGVPLGNPAVVDGTGHASSDVISSLAVGGHTVVATYNGDTDFAGSSDSFTQTVNRAATSTSLVASVNPTVFGQPVSFVATVDVVAPGAGTPTGTVGFYDGSTLLDTETLASGVNTGQATFTTSALSVGTHAITAQYSGDGSFQDSAGSATQTVNQAQSATTVTQNGDTVQGQPVTFTASVAPVAPGAGTPSGTVRFSINGAPIGSGPVALDGSSRATSAPVSGLTPGSFTVTAAYSGDGDFLPSTGSVGQVVNAASTTTALDVSPNPSAYGAPVTLTATVDVVAPGIGLPTGTVDFFDGSTLVGAAPLNETPGSDQASIALGTLAVGSHSFSAQYLGEADFNGSTSAAVGQTVQGDPTTTTLTSSENPATFGDTVTLTASVHPALANPNAMSGTVSFFDGSTLLGVVPVTNGTGGHVASLSTSALAVGSHALKASYSGDGVYGASSSASLSQAVAKAPTTLVAQPDVKNVVSATLSWAHGPLAGQTLVFTTGTTTICSATTGPDGSASCDAKAQALSILLHGYSVSYAGNASFLPSSASHR